MTGQLSTIAYGTEGWGRREWLRHENRILRRALVLSLLLHLVLGLLVKSGVLVDWQPRSESVEPGAGETVSVPLVYVDVEPAQATTEAPEETSFYSARSSLAANPDPARDGELPRVDGTQTDIIKTEDVAAATSAPSPSPPNPASESSAGDAARPAEAASLSVVAGSSAAKGNEEAEPEIEPHPDAQKLQNSELKSHPDTPSKEAMTQSTRLAESQSTPRRPRTLAEARQLAGEKMKLDGGVSRRGNTSLLDVKGTTFGQYDEVIRMAVQQRWYSLLESRGYSYRGGGKVVIEFRLHADGRVTNAKIEESNMDLNLSYLCLAAIEDPAPFGAWPDDMRRMIGEDYRDLKFQFFYR